MYAFLISSIPLLGPPVGNFMTRALTRAQNAPLCKSPGDVARTRAQMNYPYLYFNLYYVLELLGLMADFDQRNQIDRAREHHLPALFIYGNTMLHSSSYEQEMRERPDCDVVFLKPADGKVYSHWFLYEAAEDVIPIIETWLRTGVKQGCYDDPVTG